MEQIKKGDCVNSVNGLNELDSAVSIEIAQMAAVVTNSLPSPPASSPISPATAIDELNGDNSLDTLNASSSSPRSMSTDERSTSHEYRLAALTRRHHELIARVSRTERSLTHLKCTHLETIAADQVTTLKKGSIQKHRATNNRLALRQLRSCLHTASHQLINKPSSSNDTDYDSVDDECDDEPEQPTTSDPNDLTAFLSQYNPRKSLTDSWSSHHHHHHYHNSLNRHYINHQSQYNPYASLLPSPPLSAASFSSHKETPTSTPTPTPMPSSFISKESVENGATTSTWYWCTNSVYLSAEHARISLKSASVRNKYKKYSSLLKRLQSVKPPKKSTNIPQEDEEEEEEMIDEQEEEMIDECVTTSRCKALSIPLAKKLLSFDADLKAHDNTLAYLRERVFETLCQCSGALTCILCHSSGDARRLNEIVSCIMLDHSYTKSNCASIGNNNSSLVTTMIEPGDNAATFRLSNNNSSNINKSVLSSSSLANCYLNNRVDVDLVSEKMDVNGIGGNGNGNGSGGNGSDYCCLTLFESSHKSALKASCDALLLKASTVDAALLNSNGDNGNKLTSNIYEE